MQSFLTSAHWLTSIPHWLFAVAVLVMALALARSLRWQIHEVPLVPRCFIIALRVLILLTLLVCALRPSLPNVLDQRAQGAPCLYLFRDVSHSMTRADRGMGPVTRINVCDAAAEAIVRAAPGYDIKTIWFDTGARSAPAANLPAPPAALAATDLTYPLTSLRSMPILPHSQAVLFSDGCHTANNEVHAALAEYSAAGAVPLHTVCVPPGTPVPRAALTAVTMPAHAWQGERVMIAAQVALRDLARDATIELLMDGNSIARRALACTAAQQRVTFTTTPARHGLRVYTLRVTSPEPNVDLRAATAACALQVSRRTYRVLYLEGTDRNGYTGEPVYNNVPNALKEADDIACDTLVDPDMMNSPIQVKEPTVDDPRSGYPLTLEGLARYDVIINSDISLSRFSQAQVDNTARFVEELGGGYVMIGGEHAFGRGGWDETRIDRISPVDMGDERYMDGPFVWEFTTEGERHPILQIDRDPQKNKAILRTMPPFYGYNSSVRLKPNAVLLATHPRRTIAAGGNMPMLAVQEMGRGRCMAFLTDTTFLWGMDFEKHWGEPRDADVNARDNRYYKKYWQNAVRWLGHNALRHYYETRFITTDKTLYDIGDVATIEYNDPGAFAGEKLPRVTLTASTADGTQATMTMQPDAARALFACTLALSSTGRVELVARRLDDRSATASVPLFVRPVTRELFEIAPNEKLLAAIARACHGQAVMCGETLTLPAPPAAGERQTKADDLRDVWITPWLLAALLVLFTAEWIVRRTVGMA